VRAGLLDRSLRVEQRTAPDPAYGGMAANWTTFATVWAEVLEQTGRELLSAGITEAQLTIQVTMRYLPGLNASMRLVDEYGRILQINAVAMQGRKAWHVLQCSEYSASAA